MTTLADPAVRYPFLADDALDIDPAYLALHEQGPIPVQLPYGPPCWLASRYADVRTDLRRPPLQPGAAAGRAARRVDRTGR